MTDTPDLSALFAELGQPHPGRGRYDPTDRYRDFRAVFLGSDQGKRVLFEILTWGHFFADPALVGAFDTNRTFRACGEKNLAGMIFKTAHLEPGAPKARQVSTDPED